MSFPERQDEVPEFSPILGGPLYRFLRRLHLAGPTLEFPERRALLVIAITWLPLLFLSAVSGHLLGGQGLPFLPDVETHVRLLVAVPVLVFSELNLHKRVRSALRLFVVRGIICPEDADRFEATVALASRVRNSAIGELALIVFAYTVGHWVWFHEMAVGTATWYAVPQDHGLHLTLPGYWNAFVSIPLAQFVLFRWYLGLGIWYWLMFRISQLNLRLSALHPDRAGGIGFLAEHSYAFGPLLFAQGAVLAGVILSKILYGGQRLLSFKVSMAFVIVLFALMIVVPLTFFGSKLVLARRTGISQYGTFANSYVIEFFDKWMREGGRGEVMLGTTDIQSLADLANGYAVVRETRIVPFSMKDILRLAWMTAVPMSPLLLTVVPLNELIDRILKILFF